MAWVVRFSLFLRKTKTRHPPEAVFHRLSRRKSPLLLKRSSGFLLYNNPIRPLIQYSPFSIHSSSNRKNVEKLPTRMNASGSKGKNYMLKSKMPYGGRIIGGSNPPVPSIYLQMVMAFSTALFEDKSCYLNK